MNAGEIVTASHPLAGLAERLERRGPRFGFGFPVPDEPGWYSLADAANVALVAGWLDELPAARSGLRNVAAAGTALKLSNWVLRPLMAMLHIEHRFPDIGPADVWVRRDPHTGGFNGMALRPTPVFTTGPVGTEHLRAVSGHAELITVAAEHIHGVFAPALQAIRVDGRYGLRGLWGGVLDMIGAASLLVARTTDLPQRPVWAATERLIDEISRRAACHESRPQAFPVRYSGGEALFTVKGTCCLRYREHGLRANQQPGHEDAYCHTCPFSDETQRRRHLAEQLERRQARR